MIALLLLWGALAFGGPIGDGAEAWERGQIEEALQAWEDAAAEGRGSGVLYYNLGNAWYRKGDPARAIAFWRAARLMRPRDGRIAHNLALARNELEGVPPPVGGPAPWMDVVTVGEMGLLALFLVGGASGWAVLWRRRRQVTAVGPVTLALAGLVAGSVALNGAFRLQTAPLAVVVEGPVIALDAAGPEGGRRFVLTPGAEVSVVRTLGDWLLVETSDGKRGWVTRWSSLVIGPRVRRR